MTLHVVVEVSELPSRSAGGVEELSDSATPVWLAQRSGLFEPVAFGEMIADLSLKTSNNNHQRTIPLFNGSFSFQVSDKQTTIPSWYLLSSFSHCSNTIPANVIQPKLAWTTEGTEISPRGSCQDRFEVPLSGIWIGAATNGMDFFYTTKTNCSSFSVTIRYYIGLFVVQSIPWYPRLNCPKDPVYPNPCWAYRCHPIDTSLSCQSTNLSMSARVSGQLEWNDENCWKLFPNLTAKYVCSGYSWDHQVRIYHQMFACFLC